MTIRNVVYIAVLQNAVLQNGCSEKKFVRREA
jgi:hypothetical protein